MTPTLRETIRPISYQNTQDAFALMNIIKIAEKDIENGRVRKADDVFKDLKERIVENG